VKRFQYELETVFDLIYCRLKNKFTLVSRSYRKNSITNNLPSTGNISLYYGTCYPKLPGTKGNVSCTKGESLESVRENRISVCFDSSFFFHPSTPLRFLNFVHWS
jgi:hypothetical protein